MARDFHEKPFDEATQTKLDFFADYARNWLPLWLMKCRPGETVIIADFFAGPGRDADGHAGSPIRLLDVIREYDGLIRSRGIRIALILNELDPAKFEALRRTIERESVPSELCSIELLNLRFEDAFATLEARLNDAPSLLILDQQGATELSDEIFQRILRLGATDFLAFISSATLRRFGDLPAIRSKVDIPKGTISAASFNSTHRAVANHFRRLAKNHREDYYVGKFSIKKGSNIYGLIFGSGHHRGMQKFVDVCWKLDRVRGEANFDIDDEGISTESPRLFPDMDTPTKLTAFENELRLAIIRGEVGSDGAAYLYCLEEGFLPAHGRETLSKLIRLGQVRMANGARHRVSKDGCADPRFIEVLVDG